MKVPWRVLHYSSHQAGGIRLGFFNKDDFMNDVAPLSPDTLAALHGAIIGLSALAMLIFVSLLISCGVVDEEQQQ